MRPLLLIATLTSTGCASQVLSPPARYLPFEGPAQAAPDTTWVHLEGGGGAQVFGPSAAGGTLRVAHGGDEVEWSGEASLAYLDDDFPSVASRLWGAVSGGARGRFVQDFPHAFWGVGFGGGAYAGGVFISPELAAGIGFQNPYVVPYLSVTALASLPLVAETVDTTADPDQPEFDRPLVTVGFRIHFGVEVPITDHALFSLGGHGVVAADLEGTSEGWLGAGGGLKFRL